MLLIVGGKKDPNIAAIEAACKDLKKPYTLIDTNTAKIYWDLKNDKIKLNDFEFTCSSVFNRWDVFGENLNEASSIHNAITQASVIYNKKILNSKSIFRQTTKIFNLKLAEICGFKIPETFILKNVTIETDKKYITKPINGGEYTKKYKNQINCSFIQENLEGVNLRVYKIKDKFFSFTITSETLDYREDKNTKLEIFNKNIFIDEITKLADALYLDYCCVDFKKDKKTDGFLFLEINTAPMFSEFDKLVDNKISKSIVEYLTNAN